MEYATLPPGTYTATQHVARLGHGLTGYNLTRVVHTINQFDYFTQPGPGGGPMAEIRQTISLYGQPVPEPVTWMLAMVGLTAYYCSRSHALKGRGRQ